MDHPAKKQVSLWIGIFLILVTACGVQRSPTPAPTGAGANSIVISTFTATPMTTPEPLETSMATPSPDAKGTGRLPGLSPRNVTVRLEEQQFTCTSVKKGRVYYERTCTRGVPGVQVFHVLISGREPFVVDLIEASILQYENPDPNSAVSVLGFIAALPYEGATPEEAKAWVENTIPLVSNDPGNVQEMVFGGVKFLLHGPPNKLTLEIGELRLTLTPHLGVSVNRKSFLF
jgi:hypothetical protein